MKRGLKKKHGGEERDIFCLPPMGISEESLQEKAWRGGDGHLLSPSYGQVVELMFCSHNVHVFLNTCMYDIGCHSIRGRQVMFGHGS